MITYTHKSGTTYNIQLDKKKVGEIRLTSGGGWQYFPKGKKHGGNTYSKFHACLKSLTTPASDE